MNIEDDQVMTFDEWCKLNSFSRKTGERIVAAGNGPKFVQLSQRRKGVTVGENRRWQISRLVKLPSGETDSTSWGIIRYAPGSGLRPELDRCHFDGWYRDRADVQEIFHDWCERYPGWIVAVIRPQDVRW